MTLSDKQKKRYSRNILLPEIGLKGQEKLLAGKVLVIGAGGLGAPAIFYLAAAGIGTIGIIDSDKVDITNLQRQIIHFTKDIASLKTHSAAEKAHLLNPDVKILQYPERFTSKNAIELIKNYDFILDCTDNFKSKFLIADACHFAKKPYSHAGILRWIGQAITVIPDQTACYKCIFSSSPPPPARSPRPGVPGSVAGVIGCIQATEAIKFLLNAGKLLTNRVLVFDAFAMSFREIAITRNSKCPLCGKVKQSALNKKR
jgi:molybdopterin/thiamine biosynthesis adenylyltransferase